MPGDTWIWKPVQVMVGAGEVTDEPLGTKEKFWVKNPEDGHPWLFKFARAIHGDVRGEDWAEWIVHNLAEAIGIPTAEVRPAQCAGRRGIVSRLITDPGVNQRLVHGNSLLAEANQGYDPGNRRENTGYTVEAVLSALRNVGPPRGYEDLSCLSGFDVWAGYLLLDAWVGGRDRHHENWAVVSDPSNRTLAPSFDHGNALGFQEGDARKQSCLDDPKQLLRWAQRGRSHHFSGKPELVDLAHRALSVASPEARAYWHHAFSSFDEDISRSIVNCVPRVVMSEVSGNFVIALLASNRRRLFDGYPAF